MDQLNCSICNNRVQGSFKGLSDHLIQVHGLTISRDVSNNGFECGQDGCKRRYIHFSSLRKHIEEHHLLQSNHRFEEIIIPDQDFYYDDGDDEEAANQTNVLGDGNNIDVYLNDENTEFDLRQLIVRMIVRFQNKGSVTGTLLTDVLNEFEHVILSMQNFLKTKVQHYFQNKQLLDDEEAKIVLNAFDFNNPFDGLRSLNEQIDVLKEDYNYIVPREILPNYRVDQVVDQQTDKSINGDVFLKENSSQKLQESIETYDVEENGSMASPISNESTVLNEHLTHNQNVLQPQPHCSKDNTSIIKGNKSSRFSRYETVKETLQKHSQGLSVLHAAQSSFTERHRKSLIRITVAELVKVYDSYYPPDSSKTALAKAIVSEFPRLRNYYSSGGYEHYYDEQTKKGFIEFRLWTMRKKLSPSRKKYKKITKEIKKTINDDIENMSTEEMNKKISMLKFKNPTEENKKIIVKALEDTHVFRRHWITTEKPMLTQIFQVYPRLRDYNGEMIAIEFKKMFPELQDNLILKFPNYYTPHILQYTKKFHKEIFEKSQTIKNEQLRALLLLAGLLPVSNAIKNKKNETNMSNNKGKKRLYSDRNKEENMTLKSDFPNRELLQFIPDGTDVEHFERTMDNQSDENIQPYLIFINRHREGISFIQGDGWKLTLPENFSPLQAFDILYKFFYVFNLEYPRTLLNFYNFMDTYIYKMSVNPHSVVSSLHINICNVNMEESNSSDGS